MNILTAGTLISTKCSFEQNWQDNEPTYVAKAARLLLSSSLLRLVFIADAFNGV